MKTGLLSIVLLLVLQHFTVAQAYRPLLREGSQWDVLTSTNSPLCNPISINRTFFGGDTVINQLTYKKVLWQGSVSVSPHAPSQIRRCAPHAILPDIQTSTTTFLREDSVSRKVWILHSGFISQGSTLKEDLLFDFSLEVGDTLKSGYHFDNDSIFLVVDSIRNEPYSWDFSQLAKTFYMSPISGQYFLLNRRIFEGFGSGVFIYPMGFQAMPGGSILLNCYKHTSASAPNHNCAQYLSSEEVQLPELNIYPNPASDFITILGLSEADRAIVRIHDIQGKALLASSMSADYKINISTLQPGMYFLLVETNGKLITSKLLKQ